MMMKNYTGNASPEQCKNAMDEASYLFETRGSKRAHELANRNLNNATALSTRAHYERVLMAIDELS